MILPISLFALPAAVVVGVVLLLGVVDASAGIAVAALGLVAVISGAALGAFADRLPQLPAARSRHSGSTTRLAGIHDSRH
jgi:hypothetical protein